MDSCAKIYEHVITFLIKRYHPNFYAVSKRSMSWLKKFGIKASGVIYNSVDSSLYTQYKNKSYLSELEDKIIVSFAGRVIKEKGVLLLLEAFERLNNRENVVLVIAGDGPLLEELRLQYQDDSSIIFTGKLNFDQTMSLMSQSDIFVNPSIYAEGLPTAVLEAGMLKCAVLATDRGGVVEVITDNSKGVIIDDSIDSIKKELELLITNESQRSKLQEEIHYQVLKHFTWEVTVQSLVANILESD